MPHAQDFADALADIRQDAAVTITYIRGIQEIELSDVGEGMKKWAFPNASGFWVHVTSKDFLVDAKQMQIEPQQGDIIKRRNGLEIDIYRVESINNEGCFHFQDDGRTALRIHTLKIETVES